MIVVDFDNLSTTFALQNFKKSRIAYRYISALILATQNHHCVLFYTETTPQRVHTYFENPIAVDGRTEENISNPRVLLFDNDQANAPNLIHFQPTQAQYDKWRQIQTRLLLEMAYQNLHEDLGELWLSTLRRNSMPFLNELAWILSFRS